MKSSTLRARVRGAPPEAPRAVARKAAFKPARNAVRKVARHVETPLRGAAPVGLDVLQQLRVVVRLAGTHSAHVERSSGIPGAQLWALQEVAQADGLSVGELAARLRVHQTTVSNLLGRLETAALVRKGRSPHDQRVVHVHLTAAGRKALKLAAKPTRGLLPSVLDGMSTAQLRKVHDGLAVLVDCIGGFDAGLAAKPLPFTE